MASTENVVPAGRSRLASTRAVHDAQLGRRPTTPRASAIPASSGAPSAPSAATAWSSRSPWPAEQHEPIGLHRRRRGRWPARCRSPPCRRGAGRPRCAPSPRPGPSAETESRSPTSTVGSSPASRAWSSPPSAAIDHGLGGTARDGARVERRCSGDHGDRAGRCGSCHPSAGITRFRFSGRRRQPPSQPTGPVSSPCSSGTTVAGRGRGAALADDGEGDEADEDEDHPGHLGGADLLAEDEVRAHDGDRRLGDLDDADGRHVDLALGGGDERRGRACR